MVRAWVSPTHPRRGARVCMGHPLCSRVGEGVAVRAWVSPKHPRRVRGYAWGTLCVCVLERALRFGHGLVHASPQSARVCMGHPLCSRVGEGVAVRGGVLPSHPRRVAGMHGAPVVFAGRGGQRGKEGGERTRAQAFNPPVGCVQGGRHGRVCGAIRVAIRAGRDAGTAAAGARRQQALLEASRQVHGTIVLRDGADDRAAHCGTRTGSRWRGDYRSETAVWRDASGAVRGVYATVVCGERRCGRGRPGDRVRTQAVHGGRGFFSRA